MRVGGVELTLAPGHSAMKSDSTKYDVCCKLCALLPAQTCKADVYSTNALIGLALGSTVDGATPRAEVLHDADGRWNTSAMASGGEALVVFEELSMRSCQSSVYLHPLPSLPLFLSRSTLHQSSLIPIR